MTESSINPINTLSDVRGLEKLNSSNFFTWQRGIISSLGMRNLRDMLIKLPDDSAIKTDPTYLKKQEMVYYFIIGHLDDENYDKFVSEEGKEPAKLWDAIKEHYASSSGENIASHFGKLFSIKFPPSSAPLSEAISSFRSTLKLLRGLSPSLFAADIMVQVLTFYVLRILPETCRHVSTSVFHSIKVSAKIPTVEELFKEVELDILRRSGLEDEAALALKILQKPKKELFLKGKHNPLSNHSENDCFQLFPEKRESFHRRRNDKNSGCSSTIAPTADFFSNTIPSNEVLLAANGSDMKVVSEGTMNLQTSSGKLSIPNALVVPSASSILVSLGPFLNDGAVLKGYKGGADLFNRNGKLILSTRIVNNILLINTTNVAYSSSPSQPLTLHRRLGHPSERVAAKMWPDVDFTKVNFTSFSISKSHRASFPGTLPIPLNVLDMIHMYLCGPISPTSRGGNRYIFQIINGHSHMRTIRTVVSDNGGEFVNSSFSALFSAKGIRHLPTAPYTPQQNLVAERANCSLLERIRVMIQDNGGEKLRRWQHSYSIGHWY
ncbi:hypothetical protein O181_068836 [Austropuccinia psidii MF-1]|uniref:Integrase catalytic domain-containing protein n=1 Tax=Austropuccinia psidii MF-1 TaxID=1389203 RepID=A0A9Q3I495_9BASI|nr:hypothetical protein [Austropuccinia psidii MF-1]